MIAGVVPAAAAAAAAASTHTSPTSADAGVGKDRGGGHLLLGLWRLDRGAGSRASPAWTTNGGEMCHFALSRCRSSDAFGSPSSVP